MINSSYNSAILLVELEFFKNYRNANSLATLTTFSFDILREFSVENLREILGKSEGYPRKKNLGFGVCSRSSTKLLMEWGHFIWSVTILWPGLSVCWPVGRFTLVGLSFVIFWFPKRAGSYISMLLSSEHLLKYLYLSIKGVQKLLLNRLKVFIDHF